MEELEALVGPDVKKIRVVIPMPDKAKTGTYTIRATALDMEGNIISNSSYDTFDFIRPIAPDVPDTGRFSESLNIASTDYLATGLLIFFSSAIAALFLLNRKRNAK